MTERIKLFKPLEIRGITLPNRIVISPMCQYSAHDGYFDAWHLVHLGRFATGGAGLIFMEATAVQKSGRITHGCSGLWCDSQIAGHAQVTSFALQNGAVPALQLGHAGRKSGMQRPWFGNAFLTDDDVARGDMPWQTVGPSALSVDQGWPVPHEMTKAEIETFIDDFWPRPSARFKLATKCSKFMAHTAIYCIVSCLCFQTNEQMSMAGALRTEYGWQQTLRRGFVPYGQVIYLCFSGFHQ